MEDRTGNLVPRHFSLENISGSTASVSLTPLEKARVSFQYFIQECRRLFAYQVVGSTACALKTPAARHGILSCWFLRHFSRCAGARGVSFIGWWRDLSRSGSSRTPRLMLRVLATVCFRAKSLKLLR